MFPCMRWSSVVSIERLGAFMDEYSCYMYCAGVVSTVSLLRLIPGNATNKCRCTALYNDLDNRNALPRSYQHSKLLKCTFPPLKLHREWGIVSGIKVSSYSVVIFFFSNFFICFSLSPTVFPGPTYMN